ncbi:Cyclin N-terminal domain-containing protein [Heracleum sosnowskyi]|uniref:Cyclin N-terminal domain-containing protein n=1 Tax=Heracleum sosnowskyi TaxID=360622 RepID=A0AAD8M8F5_9APIA|nr:Cyclin N-terminal domain-containing protein [Heracleum sosnowskyi]
MKNENLLAAVVRDPTARVTRARAAASQSSEGLQILNVSKQQLQKRELRKNSKRVALDEKNSCAPGNQHKRRAVLKDVTNICSDDSYRNCVNATKLTKKNVSVSLIKKGSVHVPKIAPSVAVKIQQTTRNKTVEGAALSKAETVSVEASRPLDKNVSVSLIKKGSVHVPKIAPSVAVKIQQTTRNKTVEGAALSKAETVSVEASRPLDKNAHTKPIAVKDIPLHDMSDAGVHPKNAENTCLMWLPSCFKAEFTDIDSDHKDPQLCSHYAPDIYNNLRVAELMRRPDSNSMEIVQQDVTKGMRGILVDWLVEVSEEYQLVPDTLYLTVHLIDLFLSEYYIERKTLQLLGITCMLIASKYEEICAPRVEEFCFITDSTYTKTEVLTMETKVLNYLRFQLSAPTAKTFLRRYLRAAQSCYKSPSLELEYLSNYLAELTLIDNSFLKFIPSIVAASAVFLAKWTLDQSSHPWNPTLEHYTCYMASDLKPTVLELQSLQLNTSSCPLNAIRTKYGQDKQFKSVARLSSPKLLETLF